MLDATKAEKENVEVNGIKGLSVICYVIKVPEQVPIDYMHQVLLGVCRSLYFTWLKSYNLNEDAMNRNICGVSLPHDFTRRPRNFKCAKEWKAQEWRLFLLYIGRYLFYSDTPANFASVDFIRFTKR